MLKQMITAQKTYDTYIKNLERIKGVCFLCPHKPTFIVHSVNDCPRGKGYLQLRLETRQKMEQKKMIPDYVACFFCLNPQSICRVDPHSIRVECTYQDVVLPLCFKAWKDGQNQTEISQLGGPETLDWDVFFPWLTHATTLGGPDKRTIKAVRLAARMLEVLLDS
jgi:hypothetical protein